MAGEKGQRRRDEKRCHDAGQDSEMERAGRRGGGAGRRGGGGAHEREREREIAGTRRIAQPGQGGRDRLDAKVTSSVRWSSNSQCFVAEVGRFWWVELVQVAVEDVEAVEAHLGLHDRRITYTRAVRQHRRAIARDARGVVELLLFRTATAGSHVRASSPSPSTTATRTADTRTVCDPRVCGLTLSSARPVRVAATAVVVLVAAAVVLLVAVACCVARAHRQVARRALKQLFHRPPFLPVLPSSSSRPRPSSRSNTIECRRGDVRSFASPPPSRSLTCEAPLCKNLFHSPSFALRKKETNDKL